MPFFTPEPIFPTCYGNYYILAVDDDWVGFFGPIRRTDIPYDEEIFDPKEEDYPPAQY